MMCQKPFQQSLHCDLDLWTQKLKGKMNILGSLGVFVWSFMMLSVKGKQWCNKNHFYSSMHCDLDLWPLDPEINMAHPQLMGSLLSNFHDDRCKGKAITVNVVIFAGGKFRENVRKIFHVGVIFTILLLFPSYRHIGFIFAWGLFSRRRQKREKRENYPHAKISTFTVSNLNHFKWSLHCDLDLWPLDLKIKIPSFKGSTCVKFRDNRCKEKAVMSWTHFT